MELAVDNTPEFMQEFYTQIIEYGYTEAEALQLVKERVAIHSDIVRMKRIIKVPIILPYRYLNGVVLGSDKSNDTLYKLGFDIENCGYTIDICCYTWQEQQECGKVLLGSERLDKEWLNSERSSDDAFYYMNREVLQEINRK